METVVKVGESILEIITRDSFSDEKSKRIFDFRYKYYTTGNMENILDMVVDEYDYFSRRIKHLRETVLSKLKAFSGDFVIYGEGKHAQLTKQFLAKEGLDNQFAFFCVSKSVSEGQIEVSKVNNSGRYFILVPEGVYAYEMIDTLKALGWNRENFLVIPYALIFDNELAVKGEIGAILKNPENHFVVYGNDWNNILFKDLMRGSKRHFDFSIIESDNNSVEDLSFLASKENVYVVVFNGLRKAKALKAGVPEEKLIVFSNLDELQYFDDAVVLPHKKGKKEIFVDGGSLNLYTSGQFMNWCDYECDEIIAFEADKRCVTICENTLSRMPEMKKVTRVVPKGLWSGESELVFNEVDNYGSSSFCNQKGNGNEIIIPTTSIDLEAQGKAVSFIKMDIEGAELEALKGASETIKKYRPTLALSIYHKPEDIVELPAYIKTLVPEYKLYLRNYHLDHTETVLYAICE